MGRSTSEAQQVHCVEIDLVFQIVNMSFWDSSLCIEKHISVSLVPDSAVSPPIPTICSSHTEWSHCTESNYSYTGTTGTCACCTCDCETRFQKCHQF